MARSAARRKMYAVHPASESRIERASNELIQLREQIKELEQRKDDLGKDLLRMVKHEGEVDEHDKIRYETELHKFVVVDGKSRTINEAKLKQALMKLGVPTKTILKAIIRSVTETPFQYVRVDEKKEPKAKSRGDAA